MVNQWILWKVARHHKVFSDSKTIKMRIPFATILAMNSFLRSSSRKCVPFKDFQHLSAMTTSTMLSKLFIFIQEQLIQPIFPLLSPGQKKTENLQSPSNNPEPTSPADPVNKMLLQGQISLLLFSGRPSWRKLTKKCRNMWMLNLFREFREWAGKLVNCLFANLHYVVFSCVMIFFCAYLLARFFWPSAWKSKLLQ